MSFEQRKSLEKFNIRKLVTLDSEKFRNLRLTALKTDPQTFGGSYEDESKKDEEYWKSRISDPQRSFFVAEEGGNFIATAASMRMNSGNYMITGVYTLENFRGNKLSTQLIQCLIDEAKQKGAKFMDLHVNSENENAIRIYEKLGFKIIKTEKEKMGDGKIYDLHLMGKDLAQ